MIWTLINNEIKRLFSTPLAWIILAIGQLIVAWAFFTELEIYENIQSYLVANESPLGVTSLVIIPSLLNGLNIVMLIVPLLTMRAIAGERQTGRFDLLLTTPLSTSQILLGKFFAILFLLSIFWTLTLIQGTTLYLATNIDLGKIMLLWSLGLLLISSYIMAGLWLSSLTKHPVIAAIATFGLLIFLRMSGSGGSDELLSWLSVTHHLQAAKYGLLNSSDIIYFLLMTGLFYTAAWGKLVKHKSTNQQWTSRFTVILILSITAMSWSFLKHNTFTVDLSANKENTISPATAELLQNLDQPLTMTIYVSNNAVLKKPIEQLIALYKRFKADIMVQTIDPQEQPEATRTLGITKNGEILIRYNNQQQLVKNLTEKGIAKTIRHLTQQHKGWILNLQGHDELSLLENGLYGASTITKNLQARGYLIKDYNLAKFTQLPNNTDLIIIGSKTGDFTPVEISRINDYIEQGGNVLWLTDNDKNIDTNLFNSLPDISTLPGVIVDATAQKLKLPTLDNAVVTSYIEHQVIHNINRHTLFAQSAALQIGSLNNWDIETLFKTGKQSWNETGPLTGKINQDPIMLEKPGPLTLGVLLQKSISENKNQRIAFFGDSDFLRNHMLGEGDNLQLTLNLFYWLTNDTSNEINTHVKASDQVIDFDESSRAIFGIFFLFILPGLLSSSGLFITWYRKRRS